MPKFKFLKRSVGKLIDDDIYRVRDPAVVFSPQYRVIGYMPLQNILNPHCCGKCNKRFATYNKLKNHYNTHIEKKKPCPYCGRLFRYMSDVRGHVKVVHEPTRVDCEICGAKVKKGTLVYHLKRHKKEYSNVCPDCGKSFFTEREYVSHVDVVHKGVRYICFPCNKVFRCENYLKLHQTEKHDPNYKPKERICPVCKEVIIGRRQNYKVHLKSHRKDKDASYICEVCGKVLTTKCSLQDHKMVHTGEKPFVCDICGKTFNKKSLLNVHHLIHSKEKPHKCKECGKCYSQISTLTIHKRSHTGERPYECHVCDKTFPSKSQLTIHSKVHGTALSKIDLKLSK